MEWTIRTSSAWNPEKAIVGVLRTWCGPCSVQCRVYNKLPGEDSMTNPFSQKSTDPGRSATARGLCLPHPWSLEGERRWRQVRFRFKMNCIELRGDIVISLSTVTLTRSVGRSDLSALRLLSRDSSKRTEENARRQIPVSKAYQSSDPDSGSRG